MPMYVVLKSKLNDRYLTKIVDYNSRIVFHAKSLKYSKFNDVFQIYRTANDQVSFALTAPPPPNTSNYAVKYDLTMFVNASSSLVTAVTRNFLNSHSNMQQSTLFTLIKNNDLTFSLVSSENRKFVGSIDVNRFPMEVFYPTNSERVHFFIELVHNFDWNEKG